MTVYNDEITELINKIYQDSWSWKGNEELMEKGLMIPSESRLDIERERDEALKNLRDPQSREFKEQLAVALIHATRIKIWDIANGNQSNGRPVPIPEKPDNRNNSVVPMGKKRRRRESPKEVDFSA